MSNARRFLAASLGGGFLAAVMAAGPAAAQADGLPDLAAFRDTLASASDNTALAVLERGLLAQARRSRNDAGIHARLGLIALRLGAYSDAAAEFKVASQILPQWAEAWLGLAQAELALGESADTTRVGRRALLSAAAWGRAEAAFGRAAAADSRTAPAIVALARDRAASGRRPALEVIRNGLRRAVTSRSRNAESFLALGAVEMLRGDPTAALIAFEAAASLPEGRGRGLLESARLQLTQGDPNGLATYYEVAALDDSASVAGLREDIGWIATGAELEAFDRARGADRAGFVRRFWAGRDLDDLRGPGERLLEHYSRLAEAATVFSNRADQRMAVWVRHGAPDNRASLRDPGLRPNESWRYRRSGGDLVVHFAATDDTTNLRVVPSLFDLVAADGAPAADVTGDDGGLVDRLLRSRAQLSPFYQAGAAGQRDQRGAFEARERELGAVGVNLALTTDGFPMRFPRDLPARIRVASVEPGRAAFDVALVLPAFVLDSAQPDVRVRVVGRPQTSDSAIIRDTVVTLTLAGDQATGRIAVPAPAGRYDVRLAVEAGDRGLLMRVDGVTVPSQDGPRLGALAVGGLARRVEWDIDGHRLVDDPAATVARSDSLVLTTVAAGLAPGSEVRFRSEVRPVRADGREEKWRDGPAGGDWSVALAGPDGRVVLRTVGAARRLRAGRYEVSVRMEGGGLSGQRSAGEVTVVEPER